MRNTRPGPARAASARPGLLAGLLLTGLLITAVPPQAQTDRTPAVERLEQVGAGLYEVAAGESTDALYVASTGTGRRAIYVLDPRTLAVRTSFSTDEQPAFGLAFNNRTRTLYTTNTRSGTVSAIDVATGRVVATIAPPDGRSAHVFRLLVDEISNTIYVSIPQTPSRIWVIDGATHTLTQQIENVGGRSTGLALDRARNVLYTCSMASSEIIEIDLATSRVTRRFPSGGMGTTHLVLDTDGGRLFASHQQSGTVTVLDPRTGTLLETITTGAGALGLDMDRKNNLLYVANRQGGTVTVIDTRTLKVTKQLEGGTMPNTVAVDARTGDAYVTFKARPATRANRAGAAPAGVPDTGADTVARIVLRP